MDKYVRALLAAVLLTFAIASRAAPQASPCDDEDNMDAIRACVFAARERAVEARFKEVRSAIAAQDAQAAAQLDRAQAAWKAFMQASCDYSASAAPDGMYPQDARLTCQTDFMDARVRILESYRKQFRRFPAR